MDHAIAPRDAPSTWRRETAKSDARFIVFCTRWSQICRKALSTADLQREVEAVMNSPVDLEGALDGNGFRRIRPRHRIPHYKVQFTSHTARKDFNPRQVGAGGRAALFIAPVPLRHHHTRTHDFPRPVVATGEETSFNSPPPFSPQTADRPAYDSSVSE